MEERNIYRQQLNEKGQNLYDLLLGGYQQGKKKVHAPWLEEERERDCVINAIILDHPEIFYTSGFEVKSNGLITTYYLQYEISHQEIIAYQKRIKPIVEQFQKATEKMDAFHSELYIFNYLVDHLTYSLEKGRDHTIIGPLFHHTAACDGVSKLFALLCRACEVECYVITGQQENECHAWNIVNIMGHYYHLDATNALNNKQGQARFRYFNLPGEMMKKSHEWEGFPLLDDHYLEANYFIYQNSLLESGKEIEQYLANQISKGELFYALEIGKSIDSSSLRKNIQTYIETNCNGQIDQYYQVDRQVIFTLCIVN